MVQLGANVNLVICQKSKIDDWVKHFEDYYKYDISAYDLTDKKQWNDFWENPCGFKYRVGIINYELAFRRPELKKLKDFTLILDESSMIQNEKAKRSKFILKLEPKNVILLSGTPVGGKYERLWSQMRLLGWNISKKAFYFNYIDYHYEDFGGFPHMVIDGYKNVERLKKKMREHGCHFLKSDAVLDLPEQNFQTVTVDDSKELRKFIKSSVVTVQDVELVGDNTLTKMLYERQLCGQYSKAKLQVFKDLVESTDDRIIVFYNFTDELIAMRQLFDSAGINRPLSFVNGAGKYLKNYEDFDDSVTFVQYQAGAMGLNLQKANKIIYFTPPLSSELYEQSKKRTHRIGQARPCFYYNLVVYGSVEERIYKTLSLRKDYTERLYEMGT